MERGGDAWRRVGDAIRARRTELRLTQKEAARAGGLSEPVWNVIEGARQTNYRLDTLEGITRALGWSADSIDRILAGDEPTVQTRGPVPLVDAGAEVAELRARVELRGRWFVTSGRVSGGVSATRARPRGRASLGGTNASAVPETRRGPRFDHPVRGMGAGASAGAVL